MSSHRPCSAFFASDAGHDCPGPGADEACAYYVAALVMRARGPSVR